MEINKVIQILEALASGTSPLTGEMLDKESVLNDRNVIRALQIAIDQLDNKNNSTIASVHIDKEDIKSAIDLFREQKRSPTSISLTGFFLGTRQFKNHNLVSNKLYGKFKGVFTNGQLIDFFSKYLTENGVLSAPFIDDAYRKIDFFQKQIFNNLSASAVNQLKEKIKDIGVLKKGNLSYDIIEARKIHARAYEHWSDKEIELLDKAIKYTNDLDLLSDCFQRGKRSIETVGQKLIYEAQNHIDGSVNGRGVANSVGNDIAKSVR